MTKVFVAGHNGMVGSAICRQLKSQNVELVTAARSDLDLTCQSAVKNFFARHKFDKVYLAAAKVGGIHANNEYPADFIYQNLMIQNNVIYSAYESGVSQLLFLGSSCIYPKLANQPIAERELLSGSLEPTNEPYAVAKISGIKMCESFNRQYDTDFRCIMPTNLYGPGDNYHLVNSHVIPGLLCRIHNAMINEDMYVEAWGTGLARREFLFVDDLARAAVYVMGLSRQKFLESMPDGLAHVNVGFGSDITIKELTEKIASVVGYKGEIVWDYEKPDGAPRKLLDSSILSGLGFTPEITLDAGLLRTYSDFLYRNL